jgi:AraC-like DNA-binding protein
VQGPEEFVLPDFAQVPSSPLRQPPHHVASDVSLGQAGLRLTRPNGRRGEAGRDESLSQERQPCVFMIFTDDHVAVGIPMSGNCVLSQDGREAVLTPGDFAVVDTSRPYEMAFCGIDRMVVTTAPEGLVRIRPEDLSRITARRVSSSHMLTAIAWQQLGRDELAASPELHGPVLDLVSASLAELIGKLVGFHPNGHRAVLQTQIHQYIECHLGDPELAPQSIAAAHYISVRYLQKLFQSQGATVNGWIRDRRLDRCKSDLVDPRYSDRSIGAIGARWNLCPASYFSRVFRARYGLTPSEVRTKAGLPESLPDVLTAAGDTVRRRNGSAGPG